MENTKPEESKPEQEATSESLKCPHCNQALGVAAIAKLVEQTKLTVALKAEKGQKITASTFGKTLVNTEKLLQAVAREIGGSCIAFIDSLRCEEGEVSATLQLIQTNRRVHANSEPALASNSTRQGS